MKTPEEIKEALEIMRRDTAEANGPGKVFAAAMRDVLEWVSQADKDSNFEKYLEMARRDFRARKASSN